MSVNSIEGITIDNKCAGQVYCDVIPKAITTPQLISSLVSFLQCVGNTEGEGKDNKNKKVH